tara:strand:+ start:316 stop:555 length:240 start_codon:yes stop_codon:yes gene_type:complete
MGPAGKPEQIQRLKHLNGAFSRHNPLKERGMAEKLFESAPYGNLKQPHEGELGAEEQASGLRGIEQELRRIKAGPDRKI